MSFSCSFFWLMYFLSCSSIFFRSIGLLNSRSSARCFFRSSRVGASNSFWNFSSISLYLGLAFLTSLKRNLDSSSNFSLCSRLCWIFSSMLSFLSRLSCSYLASSSCRRWSFWILSISNWRALSSCSFSLSCSRFFFSSLIFLMSDLAYLWFASLFCSSFRSTSFAYVTSRTYSLTIPSSASSYLMALPWSNLEPLCCIRQSNILSWF